MGLRSGKIHCSVVEPDDRFERRLSSSPLKVVGAPGHRALGVLFSQLPALQEHCHLGNGPARNIFNKCPLHTHTDTHTHTQNPSYSFPNSSFKSMIFKAPGWYFQWTTILILDVLLASELLMFLSLLSVPK